MTSIINGIKGIFIGLALIIPGLSGSIFAVVVGLYDKILLAVSNFRKNWKPSTLFLLPIALGAAVGILASAKLLEDVCENYKLQSYAFFVGLVLGVFPLVVKKIMQKKLDWRGIVIGVVSFAAIVFVGQLAHEGEGATAITSIANVWNFVDLFVSGVVICAMMMVPGVSGSVLLMLVGKWDTILGSAAAAGKLLQSLASGQSEAAYGYFMQLLVVVPFLLGALVGLALIAKLMSWLLKRYESLVYYGVFGLVSGVTVSLVIGKTWEGVMEMSARGTSWVVIALWAAVFAVIGALCTNFLDMKKPEDAE